MDGGKCKKRVPTPRPGAPSPSSPWKWSEGRLRGLAGPELLRSSAGPLKTAWDGMLAELAAYKEQTGGFAIAGMRKELAKWVGFACPKEA